LCNRFRFEGFFGVLEVGNMLVGLLTTLLVVVSIVLILLIVALQHGNEGGIGSAFGGGNSAGFFGASGGVALIVRATWIFGAAFFALSTALAWVKTYDKFGVTRELESVISEGIEAPQVAPASDAQPPAADAQSPAQPPAADAQSPAQPEPAASSGDNAPAPTAPDIEQNGNPDPAPVQPAQ
jgi:preprotein translocase subunit SecG